MIIKTLVVLAVTASLSSCAFINDEIENASWKRPAGDYGYDYVSDDGGGDGDDSGGEPH